MEEAGVQLYPNSTQSLKGGGWVNSDTPRPLTLEKRPGNHSLPNVVRILELELSKSLTRHLLPGSNGGIAEVNK